MSGIEARRGAAVMAAGHGERVRSGRRDLEGARAATNRRAPVADTRHGLDESPLRRAVRRNLSAAAGLALLGGLAVLAAALVTWSVDDPSWSHSTDQVPKNLFGAPGAVVADLVMQLIGATAAVFLAPVAIWAVQLLTGRRVEIARSRWTAWIAAIFAGAAFMSALPPTAGWPLPTGLGGAIGDLVLQVPAAFTGGVLTDSNRLVCMILFGPLTVALMVFAAGYPRSADDDLGMPVDEDDLDEPEGRLQAFAGALAHGFFMARSTVARRFGRKTVLAYPGDDDGWEIAEDADVPAAPRAAPRSAVRAASRLSRLIKGLTEPKDGLDDLVPAEKTAAAGDEPPFDDDEPDARFAPDDRLMSRVGLAPRVDRRDGPEADDGDDEDEGFEPPRPVAMAPARAAGPAPARGAGIQVPLRGPAARIAGGQPAAEPRAAGRVQPPAAPPQPGRANGPQQLSLLDGYEFPPLSLLSEARPTGTPVKISADALEQNARLLEGVLEDFGVKGEIINVRPGPVVTLYELEPAPGIKSSRVIGLADDIARSMSAVAARVAVIPGKNAIGIELPNQRRETVYLRELVGAQDFEKSKARLALALGKTIGGEPVIVDLARTPHMLVAGTTGSGKSVSINTMILSLLYRLTPDECRLIMIDPKMLELSVYDGIPHLLSPVVTDPRKAVVALKWTVREMEDRYKKMSKLGVRNIEGFNARVAQAQEKGETIARTVQTGFDRETGEPVFETEQMDLKPLPFIVVIIDEMADLMMVAGKEIEGTVQRLAQMARAAGIHVIMATQRPSVDVITGTIKANFPTRISFQVTSKIDSRTILGEQGAEQLLGQGDMLYMAGGGRIQRVHGPFVSDGEVEAIVAHLKSQGAPDYLEAITEDEDGDGPAAGEAGGESWPNGMSDGEGADLYDQAVAVVLRDKKASTSYIQRRLGIGYNRAASLIERMEKEGIVGPSNHAGKREILVGGGGDDEE
ncbi:FtsK/SpoIIIE family DNA translocase [Mongoliimonas terrestris]|uniref:FtsK/SpoIIIE family DNA translocase n=1 Tax=Mongoliimonas terrestris TaxID=1709001 RepID=UPI000A5B5555|nr:DNA translocase FtsK [Mongoliimonas terrestris]